MLRCSPEAFAKCPTRHICEKIEDATFTEGSECDLFNQSVMNMPITNADRIRVMSDEELAVFLERATGGCETCANVCSCNGPEELPPKSICHQGVLEWLQQPVGEVHG